MSNYKILIETKEFHQKILDCVLTDEINRMFESTYFASKENSSDCKAAMIHGMVMASLLASSCESYVIDVIDGENNDS